MARQNVRYAVNESRFSAYGPVAGWFDPDKATEFAPKRYFDGNNMLERGSDRVGDYTRLYRTAGGRWVEHSWSDWVGVNPTWSFISPAAAKGWLLLNDFDDAVEEFFGELPEESGPDNVRRFGTKGDVRNATDEELNAAARVINAEIISRGLEPCGW